MAEENLVIHNIFTNTASRFPEKVALQLKKDNAWQRFTYKELENQSLKLATFLVQQGFKKGGFAALVLENRPEWPIIYLGLMYAGLCCVPLNPELSHKELSIFLKDCDAKIIFCSYELFEKKISQDLRKQVNKIVLLDAPALKAENLINFKDTQNINIDKTILPDVSPSDTASLVYTSGTTAQSKGVMLTHRNICSNFKSIQAQNIVLSSDNILAILPLYHAYAFMGTLIAPLFIGSTITYFPLSFKPLELSSTIKEAKVTILIAVPQLFSLLYKGIADKIKKIPSFLLPLLLPLIRNKLRSHFGSSLRLLVSGGARLEPEVGKNLSHLLGVRLIEGYGLTETSPIVSLNPAQRPKFGSVGKAIPDVEIKIMEPDESGVGEVLIKGPNVMSGYFKRPDLTSEVIIDGWFHSGDLGYIDKDGYLFLSARKKDVIVLSSGKNIYPEELEEHFIKIPYIKELCIIPKSEERFGRKIDSLYAVVVPNLEYFRQRGEVNIQGKIRWELENLSKDLPSYKHIMGFIITKEELPKTALKKIKRYQVAKKFSDFESVGTQEKDIALSEEDTKILEQGIAKKIIDYLSKELKKPILLNSHLEIDLGIDSLSRVELGLGLEALFSIKIPEEVLGKVSTVKEVILEISGIIEKGEPQKEIVKEAVKSWSQVLQEPPSNQTLERIRLKNQVLNVLFTWIFKIILLLMFRILWFLKIRGKNLVPTQGPYLICPNHASYLDGFVVFSGLPLKCALKTFFLGYSNIFEQPVFRWAIKLAHLIPIDPNTNLTEAMQAVSHVIRHERMVCIFPEGRRSVDEKIQEFKKGVAILIKELNIPVVPVYIKGSHRSWPRTSRLPYIFSPLKIIFGKPFTWKELIEKYPAVESIDEYGTIASALREEVLKLANQGG